MTVYVLHFSRPYGHAQHYIGFTPDEDPARRIAEHLACNGKASPLVKAAIGAGAQVLTAAVFRGADRSFERRLKNRHDTRQWCPCCDLRRQTLPNPAAPKRSSGDAR